MNVSPSPVLIILITKTWDIYDIISVCQRPFPIIIITKKLMQKGNGDNAFVLIFLDNHGCPKLSFQTAVWLYVFNAFKPQTDIFYNKEI